MNLLNISGGKNGENHQSKVINAMRFPLITLVVLFHLQLPGEALTSQYASFNVISQFFSADGIAQLAVPTFFIISGYYFFYNANSFDRGVYTAKIKKRVRTLFVPYLLWNGIPILGIVAFRFFAGLKDGTSLSLISEFGDSIGWFRAFWDCGEPKGHPFDVPLWYIRDLMVLSIFSPLIYFLIRKLGIIYVAIVCCLFLTNHWFHTAGLDSRAWFFFSFGAYLSLNNVNMVYLLRRYAMIIIPVAMALLGMTVYCNHILTCIQPILSNLFLLFGVTALIGGFSFLVSKGVVRDMPFLTKSVFFIYGFHVFPLSVCSSVTSLAQSLTNNILVETHAVSYFLYLILSPILVLCSCLLVYYLMGLFMPKTLSVLTGQR